MKHLFFAVWVIIGSFFGVNNNSIPQHISKVMVSPTAKPSPTLIPTATLTPTPTLTPTRAVYLVPTQPTIQPTQTTTTQEQGLNNDNYYTNSSGNEVHSPAYSINGSVPSGETAKCNDGTYSFSQNHSGTCSGHGGVSQWL